MKWTIAYGVLAALGWFWGFGAGSGWSSIELGLLLTAALPALLLLRWTQVQYSQSSDHLGSPPLSFAHKSWLGSAWGTGVVLIAAWVFKGWSLPRLTQADFILDPAGALGWNEAWLSHVVLAVRILMTIGTAGMIWGMYSWWKSMNKNTPSNVVWAWAFIPFFWMATLGLVMGVSEPWRKAPDQELSSLWGNATTPQQQKELTEKWVQESHSPAKAVWAHAALLMGHQEGWLEPQEVYSGLQKLAAFNGNRSAVLGFVNPKVVGVDAKLWCKAQTVSKKASVCTNPHGRIWNISEIAPVVSSESPSKSLSK